MPRTQRTKPEGYNKAFPRSLRRLLEESGKTKKELAAYLNKSGQAISYYCDGTSSPDWETIVEIEKFFSVSADYLLGIKADPSPTPSAVEDLGLTPKAVQYLRTLHELGKVSPYETNRLLLISYLLGHKNFDWFLVQCLWYVNLKNKKSDTSFWKSPDYEFCEDALDSHGYTISTPELQACAIFSEKIIPKFRALLTEASEQWEVLKQKEG